MKRRTVIGIPAGLAAAHIVGGCAEEQTETTGTETSGSAVNTFLADNTFEELRARYHADLYDDFLPFMDRFVIDHEYGGFMCNADRDGTRITSDKNTTNDGRGIWVYSFLYNKLTQDQRYLETAKKTADFVLKIRPPGDEYWLTPYTREGTPLKGKGGLYDGLFIANGLQELSKAPGCEMYHDPAREIFLGCMRRYDNPAYDYLVTYLRADPPPIRGPRVLGHWMVILRCATQMLEFDSDPEIEAIAGRSVDAIMRHHHNPAYNLMNEVINHDLSRTDDDYAQFSYTGHAIETLWMVLYEAMRLGDRRLFEEAADKFKFHVEVAWDDVYSGAFRSLDHVDNNVWKVDKALWLQEEILIGTLCMIEHTGDEWAKTWFVKVFDYVQDRFPLRQYGFPLWILYADRKVTFKRHYTRIGNFHHPRHLMLNLLSLDRMIERGGKVSGLFV